MNEEKKPELRSAVYIEDCHGTQFDFSGSNSTGFDRFVTMKGSSNNKFVAEGVFMNAPIDVATVRDLAASPLFADIVAALGPNVSPADLIDAIEAKKAAGADPEIVESNVRKSRLGNFLKDVGPEVFAFVIRTVIKLGES